MIKKIPFEEKSSWATLYENYRNNNKSIEEVSQNKKYFEEISTYYL